MTTPTVSRETANGTKLRPIAGGAGAEPAGQAIVMLEVESIDVGPNVRVTVENIDELAASIIEHGVLQPIKVRIAGAQRIVVWGQRRLLAARKAGLTRIPAIVTDEESAPEKLAIEQLVENLHRADLPPLDRARSIRAVVDAGTSQADLARELGLHPSTVANDLRLLTLDPRVQDKVEAGEISPTHARTIASLPPKQQHELANRAVSEKWSTHQLEREIQWKQDAAQQDERSAAKTAKWIPKAIAGLEAAGVAKGVTVYVSGDNYTMDSEAVRAAIRKAGWPTTNYYPRPRDGCDCTAVRLDVGGRKLEVQPVCTDDQHRDRAVNLEHLERKRDGELLELRMHQVRGAIAPALAGLPAPIARLLFQRLRSGSGYYGDWSTTSAMSSDELTAGLIEQFSEAWQWRQVAIVDVLRELGVEPAELPEPEAKKPRPAADSGRLPRGTCSVCQADVALRKGGLVREHGRYDRNNPGVLVETVCAGAGLPAVVAA